MAKSSAKIAFTYLHNEDNVTSFKRSHAYTATRSAPNPAAGHHLLELLEQSELDMEQQTGFKSGKEYTKAEYCHLAYLTYTHSTY